MGKSFKSYRSPWNFKACKKVARLCLTRASRFCVGYFRGLFPQGSRCFPLEAHIGPFLDGYVLIKPNIIGNTTQQKDTESSAVSCVVVVHEFNPSTREVETGGSL